MEKQDLTQYSDNELSLVVMNDEYYYGIRRMRNLREMLAETLIFTDEQWEVLESDLNSDDY